MRREERVLQLVERIYEAVIEPDSWQRFIEDLSEALGGAAVQLSLRVPEMPVGTDPFFRVGLDASYQPVFAKLVIEGLPWGAVDNEMFRGRFGLASEVIPNDGVEDTAFYLDYMQPQGLAPEWPVCHIIAAEAGLPLAGIVIYRREGCRAIEDDDLGLLDQLVPHLSRAYGIYCQLVGVRHEHRALTEVIDRLPVGVILVDSNGRAVLKNRSVDRILELEDGLSLDDGRLQVELPREHRMLQRLIAESASGPPSQGRPAGHVMTLTRRSGRRPFAVMSGPLLAARPDTISGEAAAIVFVADPDAGIIPTTEVLEALFQLTRAEAELVRLVAEGCSLEEVARQRGVTMNTVRSQLKQVFSKTDTNRQGELVHLVLTSVASIKETESN